MYLCDVEPSFHQFMNFETTGVCVSNLLQTHDESAMLDRLRAQDYRGSLCKDQLLAVLSFFSHRTLFSLRFLIKQALPISFDFIAKMSAQPVIPIPQIVIMPTTVLGLGPQLSRLPDELLLQIFKIVASTMFPASSRFNDVIGPHMFNILNHHYAINRIRNVSTDFAAFFMEAFYANFNFSFKHSSVFNLESDYLTSFPASVPHRHLRHHLRSMRIEIAMENYYFTPQTDFTVPRTSWIGRQSRKITTADQMIAFCPSARFLLHLTNPDYGFCNLRLLDLHIRTDFRLFPVDDAFLRVLEQINFVVTAGKVLLAVTDNADFVRKEHLEVKKRIVVVE